MIDIHAHIIPALDDGPPDMDTSIRMGHIAAQEGIETIISTSHSGEGMAVGREAMQTRLEQVRTAWTAAGINIRLELGLEIFLQPDTVAHLKSGQAWTLAQSQYVLVEVPYQPWPTYADHLLFDMQVAGFVPILAHPERYKPIQSDPNFMYSLAERGVLAQVTAVALLGIHGHEIQRCAETLVRHNLVQFISSDAHGLSERKRAPHLRAAIHAAANLIGLEAAEAMVTTNPSHILDHRPLAPSPEHVSPRRRLFGGLFRG